MIEYYPFPAVLKTGYNDIEEHGTAQVAAYGNAINFYGDFVPLVPLGHEAAIHWILGDKTLASFAGSVYLSSAKMLQLVDVDEERLATARTLFITNTRLPALVAPAQRPKAEKRPVEILYLSMGLVKLLTRDNIEEKTELHLFTHVDFLTLHALEIRVRKRIIFGKEETLLLCEVDGLSRENYVAMSTYVAKLEKKNRAEEG